MKNSELKKGTKRPKQINGSGSLFALFIPERVKIHSDATKKVLMNFNVYLPKDIFAIMVLLPSLQKEKLVMKDYQYTEENIRKVELELFNKTHTTIFDFKKDEKLLVL